MSKASSGTPYPMNMPKTNFPARGALPVREREILRAWDVMDIYHLSRQRTAGGPPFTLHDGPPFSNGEVHAGLAFNVLLKDFIVKFRSMQGFDAPIVPGWDAHGLPTEISAIRSFSIDRYAIEPLDLRARCAEASRRTIFQQRKEMQRLGVRGDWDGVFVTMLPPYESAELEILARIVELGGIYRELRAVNWCPTCESALATAELEFSDAVVDEALIAFPLFHLPNAVLKNENIRRMSLVVSLRDPWMLPGAVALTIDEDKTFALMADARDQERFTYLLAQESMTDAARWMRLKKPYEIATLRGGELAGASVMHPLDKREIPVIPAAKPGEEFGTGVDILAPAHRRDDMIPAREHNLAIINPLGSGGVFGKETGSLKGKSLAQGQERMLAKMDRDGDLLAHRRAHREIPHCWRCHHQVITRATPQWFLRLESRRESALEMAGKIDWQPTWAGARMAELIGAMPDWCISRQRAWGVPIPALECGKCGEALLSAQVIRRAADIVREEGSDAWYRHPARDFITEGLACPSCGAESWLKGADILDVWFDSGCSGLALMGQAWAKAEPADLVVEGEDQLRGWFFATLAIWLALEREQAPFNTALTHGFVSTPSEQREKEDLNAIIHRVGADPLRWWAASVDWRGDQVFSADAMKQAVNAYRRVRQTARFLLGNLFDFDPENTIPFSRLEEVDKAALHDLAVFIRDVTSALDHYAFHRAAHLIEDYCRRDLSAWHFTVAKDRLYLAAPSDPSRRSAQTAYWLIADALARIIAPVLSFTADEMWRNLPEAERTESAQLAEWPREDPAWFNPALGEKWALLRKLRKAITTATLAAHKNRVIPSVRAAKVIVYSAGEELSLLESVEDTLAELFQVAEARALPLDKESVAGIMMIAPETGLEVLHTNGARCPRCRWWRAPGRQAAHPELCARCARQLEPEISRAA